MNVYDEYKDYGLQVVAFPCNQFLNQEPGSSQEIKAYAREQMGAQFPLMQRCDVNGETAHNIFKYLRKNTECFINP